MFAGTLTHTFGANGHIHFLRPMLLGLNHLNGLDSEILFSSEGLERIPTLILTYVQVKELWLRGS